MLDLEGRTLEVFCPLCDETVAEVVFKGMIPAWVSAAVNAHLDAHVTEILDELS